MNFKQVNRGECRDMTSYGNKPKCCSPPIPAYQHNGNLFILLACQLISTNDQVLITSKVVVLQWLLICDYLWQKGI